MRPASGGGFLEPWRHSNPLSVNRPWSVRASGTGAPHAGPRELKGPVFLGREVRRVSFPRAEKRRHTPHSKRFAKEGRASEGAKRLEKRDETAEDTEYAERFSFSAYSVSSAV